MKLVHMCRYIALLLVTTALFAGCDNKEEKGAAKPGNPGETKTMKFAFVTNNASDYWKLASNGVHKYEKEAGIKVDIKMPPNGHVDEQNSILEDLVSQGYNGIAVSVIAPDDQIKELDRVAAKTILLCHDSDAPKSKRKLYIGSLNYEAGRTLGREIVRLLPNGGKIAVFVGTFSADNAHERLRGIEKEIEGKNIEIVAKKEDGEDRAKAVSNVEDVIVAYKDVNLVCGLWSYNGPAIAAALERSGKKGKVLAAVFDQEDGTLDGIEKGLVSCTVVQHPYQMGYIAAKMMYELATKGDSAMPKDPIVDTGVEIIDASKLKKFREELAEEKK